MPTVNDLLALAKQHGCTVSRTRRNHWKVLCPDGVTVVIVSGTPSDWRALQNAAAQIRRGGAPGVRL